MGSHRWQWEVIWKTFWGLILPFKGWWSKKSTMYSYVEHCKTGQFFKCQKYGLNKAQFLTPHYQWHRGIDLPIFRKKITPRKFPEFKISSRHIYWDQGKAFNEIKGNKKKSLDYHFIPGKSYWKQALHNKEQGTSILWAPDCLWKGQAVHFFNSGASK